MTIELTWFDYLLSRYPPTITVDQLSEITSEHPNTIRNLISKGAYGIPSYKHRSKRLFRITDVARFIEQQFEACNGRELAGENERFAEEPPSERVI